MKVKRYVFLTLVVLLFSASFAVAANYKSKEVEIELADNTDVTAYVYAKCKEGIAYDTVKTKFYFVEEDDETWTDTQMDAILSTYPVCTTIRNRSSKVLDSRSFSTSKRSYVYSDSWVYVSLGIQLKVKYASPSGYKYIYCSKSY